MSFLDQPVSSPLGPPPALELRGEPGSGGHTATWIRVGGELDLGTAPKLELALQRALDGTAPQVVLDLRELTFIDCAGLRLVIQSDARARHSERRLVIVRGPACVDRMLSLFGLGDRLTIIDAQPTLAPAPTPNTGSVADR